MLTPEFAYHQLLKHRYLHGKESVSVHLWSPEPLTMSSFAGLQTGWPPTQLPHLCLLPVLHSSAAVSPE